MEPLNNFTPRAQQVLALSRKEAERFHHNYVGTEHLLLGLINLGQGVAVNVLQIMFPYLGLISLVAFAGGIQNTHERFSLPAATPIIFTL